MDKYKAIDYLKERIKYFPACKLLEYKNSIKYNFKREYQPITSNRQISALIKISKTKRGMRVYHRLLQLLSKKIYVNHYTDFLNEFLNKDMTDDQVYELLKKYKRGGADPNCTKDILRSQIYYCMMHQNILQNNTKFKINNYLDLGGGECRLAQVFGNMLGLSNNKIYCADIEQWGGYTSEERKKLPINIIDLEENKPLPIENNKFSFVSTFMVLHHVKDLELMLSEINRIIKKGGYLMIREHDSQNYADAMLADIEHMLFELTDRNGDKNKIKSNYYGKYYDMIEWSYMLHLHGFEPIYTGYVSDSIYFELTPTRAFIGIYKKN